MTTAFDSKGCVLPDDLKAAFAAAELKEFEACEVVAVRALEPAAPATPAKRGGRAGLAPERLTKKGKTM